MGGTANCLAVETRYYSSRQLQQAWSQARGEQAAG